MEVKTIERTCDFCKKQDYYHPERGYQSPRDGWYKLMKYFSFHNQSETDFCSLGCLKKFVLAEGTKSKEQKTNKIEVDPLTCIAEIKGLQAQVKELAHQAIMMLQYDFGYYPQLDFGNYPLRHKCLWDMSLEVLGGQIPDVEKHRDEKEE